MMSCLLDEIVCRWQSIEKWLIVMMMESQEICSNSILNAVMDDGMLSLRLQRSYSKDKGMVYR